MRTVYCSPESAGPALGLIDDFEFSASEEPLRAGDRIIMFTDGLVEAAAPDGEEFGITRLAATLAQLAGRPPDAALNKLLADVKSFCGDAPFADDVCAVALDVARR